MSLHCTAGPKFANQNDAYKLQHSYMLNRSVSADDSAKGDMFLA